MNSLFLDLAILLGVVNQLKWLFYFHLMESLMWYVHYLSLVVYHMYFVPVLPFFIILASTSILHPILPFGLTFKPITILFVTCSSNY